MCPSGSVELLNLCHAPPDVPVCMPRVLAPRLVSMPAPCLRLQFLLRLKLPSMAGDSLVFPQLSKKILRLHEVTPMAGRWWTNGSLWWSAAGGLHAYSAVHSAVIFGPLAGTLDPALCPSIPRAAASCLSSAFPLQWVQASGPGFS